MKKLMKIEYEEDRETVTVSEEVTRHLQAT